jgi:4-hydroxy-tetrahydrodipicolinate reductase
MKVPESALQGHAYHTYRVVSADGSVSFEFQHNVVGRTTYAEGTVDACLFLHAQRAAGNPRTLFNMVDVLQAGAMR